MPETLDVQVEAYRFHELPEDVQERLIEKKREEAFSDYFITESISEMFDSFLDDLFGKDGHEIKDVYWSLGYSQGDGVGFHGQIDLLSAASDEPREQGWKWADEYGLWLTFERLEKAAPTLVKLAREHNFDLSYRLTGHGRYPQTAVHNLYDDLLYDLAYAALADLDLDLDDEEWEERVEALFDLLNEESSELDDFVEGYIRDLEKAFERAGYDEIEYQTSEEVARERLQYLDLLYDAEGNELPSFVYQQYLAQLKDRREKGD